VSRIDELPTTAHYLLIQPEKEREVMESERWSPWHAHSIQRVTDYRKRTVILARIGEK
jgi:hypothetical protein